MITAAYLLMCLQVCIDLWEIFDPYSWSYFHEGEMEK